MRGSFSSFVKMLAIGAVAALGSCQATAVPQPAVLERADDAALAELKAVIATAMGKARIEFGAMDLENSPEIPVLPPRPDQLEGQSPAMPTYFDLVIDNGECAVIDRSTGQAFPAESLLCTPAGD